MKLFKLLLVLCTAVCCSGSYGQEITSLNQYKYSLQNSENYRNQYNMFLENIPNKAERNYAVERLLGVCKQSVRPDSCIKALTILAESYGEMCKAANALLKAAEETDKREIYLFKLLQSGQRL